MSPELLGPSDLVDKDDWQGLTENATKFWAWMSLVDMDVQSAQMSFHDYLAAKNAPQRYRNPIVDARMLHSAKCFVCAVRRVTRLLEGFPALCERPDDFPSGTTKLVKTAWMKERTFLNGFTEPRNVIEHISGEIRGKERWFLVYWSEKAEDHLESVVEKDGEDGPTKAVISAEITADALRRVLKVRAEIVDGIHKLAETNGKA